MVDQFTGEVVTDVAEKSSLTAEVTRWATEVAVVANTSRTTELDDVMVTSRDFYHLVRRITPVGRRPVLVVLALDRERSNLAAARRELAVCGLQDALGAELPLPRRSDSSRSTRHLPPPVRRPEQPVPLAPGQRWAHDVSTMRRLLVGLRSLR